MGKVINFSPSQFETKYSFTKANASLSNSIPSSQLNIFRHQARIIPIEIGKTNFEMALTYDGKDNKIAKAYYLRAIENNENIADSYCNLAIIEGAHDLLKALQYFIAAINEDTFHYQSNYNLGCLYLDLDNLDLAKIYFQKAINIEPSHSSAYYNLNIVLNRLGDKEAANEMLLKYKFLVNNEYNDLDGHIFLTKTT